MMEEKKRLKPRYLWKWILGSLVWIIVWVLSAALKTKVVFGGIFILGIALAVPFVYRMFKNNADIIALSKKDGTEKFNEFLDRRAIRIFLEDKSRDDVKDLTFWTRQEFGPIQAGNK
jgi:hypothetical protein